MSHRIEVIKVPKEDLAAYGGSDWKELVKARPEHLLQIDYGVITSQPNPENRPQWEPRVNRIGETEAYLPYNYAWLRNINGRAYLYLQNW